MTWSPGLQTNQVNLREGHSDAVKALLVANLASLNQLLAATIVVAGQPVTLPGPPNLAPCSIIRGDLDSIPPLETYGLFWCQVVAGGERDARDVESQLIESPAQFDYTISTNIDFLVQPMAFPGCNPVEQAMYRERLRDRLTDWMLIAVFNNSETISLALPSQCFQQPNDTTYKTVLAEIAAGFVQKGYGSSDRVHELHCCLRSQVVGSVG
jgi:hypothetical protein